MDVTFIIPVFNLSSDQFENFKFVLKYILKTEKPVIVVEQIGNVDAVTEVGKHCEDNVTYIPVPIAAAQISKSKLINLGVQAATTKYIWMNDVDCFLKFSDIIKEEPNEDFLQPYKIAKRLSREDSETLKAGGKIDVSYTFDEKSLQNEDYRFISLFGALCFIAKKTAFNKIGKMDEEFTGWGFEDNEFAYRVLASKHSFKILEYNGVHLWHPPLQNDIISKTNKALFVLKTGNDTFESSVNRFKSNYIKHIKTTVTADIVTLFRGNMTYLKNIDKWISKEKFLCDVNITWILNTSSEKFKAEAIRRISKYDNFRIIVNNEEFTPSENYYDGRHEYVYSIYSKYFKTSKADYICTLEDDMIPPRNSFNSMLNHLRVDANAGVAASLYASKDSPNLACYFPEGEFDMRPNIADVRETGLVTAERSGGGFTLWNYRAILNSLPLSFTRYDETTVEGWDWYLSRKIREQDLKILVDTTRESQHLG